MQGKDLIILVVILSLCLVSFVTCQQDILDETFIFSSNQLPSTPYNHTLWDSILKDIVHESKLLNGVTLNVVDYVKLRRDERFAQYLNLLANWDLKTVLTIEEELALYINAYNAWSMQIVASNPCKIQFGRFCYPVKSIRDVGFLHKKVWDLHLVVVAGNKTSLNDIEKHLISMGYPQIHSCLVDASISCPNIHKEAFFPDTIHEQLDRHMRVFLNNPTKGLSLNKDKRSLSLSKIFSWNVNDFINNNNTTHIIDYIIPYAPVDDQGYLLANRDYFIDSKNINFMNYDWRLNQLISTNTIIQTDD
jgi:hypothetical protein